MNFDNGIKTVKDFPQHHAIGRFFKGWDGQVYYCQHYDPRVDYVVVNVADPTLIKDISPRAIGRTFHSCDDDWHPLPGAESRGRTYYAVDSRVPPEQLQYAPMQEQDAQGIDERVALFIWENDAKQFIKAIQAAAAKLQAERAEKAALIAA